MVLSEEFGDWDKILSQIRWDDEKVEKKSATIAATWRRATRPASKLPSATAARTVRRQPDYRTCHLAQHLQCLRRSRHATQRLGIGNVVIAVQDFVKRID
jgi:hypothetical protein